MAKSIFGAAWWPVRVAVAWALTRDRAFVERSNRAGKSLLSVEVALAMGVDGKPTQRYFKGSSDAWSALHEEMAAGKVRASGTPFRVADLQGNAVETNDMPREIPAAEIASLRLRDNGDDMDCLIPEDWRVAHGSNWKNLRGYRNVQVFRDDALRLYQPKQASVAPKSKSGPGAKTQGVSEAISQLWPNGIPKGLSGKDRNKAIIRRMRQNGSSIPNSPERAIQRVLRAGQSK